MPGVLKERQLPIFNVPIPFTGKEVPLKYRGEAKIGDDVQVFLDSIDNRVGLDPTWRGNKINFTVDGNKVTYERQGEEITRVAVAEEINNTDEHPLLRRAGIVFDSGYYNPFN